jgi:hypothetical protein
MNKFKQRIADWLAALSVTWHTVLIAAGIGVLVGVILTSLVGNCTASGAPTTNDAQSLRNAPVNGAHA